MNADALISLILISVFIFWFYGPWQSTCTDYARQIIFEQRDKLFDIAASGRMAFQSREYGTIRSSLNAMIRYAHDATLPRLIYTYIALRRKETDYKKSALYKATEQIQDSRLYEEMQIILAKSMMATACLIIFKSLPCVMCLIIFLPIILFLSVCAFFFSKIKNWIGSMLRHIGGMVQAEAEFEEKFIC
jgi:hypothetical protein